MEVSFLNFMFWKLILVIGFARTDYFIRIIFYDLLKLGWIEAYLLKVFKLLMITKLRSNLTQVHIKFIVICTTLTFILQPEVVTFVLNYN